jgi:hypothetical protein
MCSGGTAPPISTSELDVGEWPTSLLIPFNAHNDPPPPPPKRLYSSMPGSRMCMDVVGKRQTCVGANLKGLRQTGGTCVWCASRLATASLTKRWADRCQHQTLVNCSVSDVHVRRMETVIETLILLLALLKTHDVVHAAARVNIS